MDQGFGVSGLTESPAINEPRERDWLPARYETFQNVIMRELSFKRGQRGKFRRMLRRKIARSSDSSNSTAGRGPKVLTASRLVQQGLRSVLLVGMLVLIDIYAPRFFRYQNLVNILLQVSLLGLMTIGMTVVMIAGGIYLSLPANIAIGAVLCAILIESGGNWHFDFVFTVG